MEKYSVLLVCSITFALQVEKHLIKASIKCKLIPIPRHLSSSCGVCVRIATKDKEKSEKLLLSSHVPLDGLHDLD